ncbi:MAG: Asp-tRNA(Asn)/Glu-tRNA(Gln) amidotransferase subunit GatC [Candidatus Saccharimonadales bacterium]
MADLTRDDVLKLAQLARLELADDEVESFKNELDEILHYVELLDNADIEGLEPTSQVTGLVNVERHDVFKDYGYTPKDLLENVPDTLDDHIKVKRMIS